MRDGTNPDAKTNLGASMLYLAKFDEVTDIFKSTDELPLRSDDSPPAPAGTATNVAQP